jgi:thioredoxin 1
MIRRNFLTFAAAASAAGILVPSLAQATTVTYTPGVAEAAMADGTVSFLIFNATWCSTCRAQDRVIDALKAANPAYERDVLFISVDWDDYGQGALAQSLNVPRRSTLIAMNGATELGRIVAGTGRTEIAALMTQALNAAQP